MSEEWYKAQYASAMVHFRKEQKKSAELQRQLEEKTRMLEKLDGIASELQDACHRQAKHLAAYEAQPVLHEICRSDISKMPALEWFLGTKLIAKPSTTEHLDALIAEAEKRGELRGMEMAADVADSAAEEASELYGEYAKGCCNEAKSLAIEIRAAKDKS